MSTRIAVIDTNVVVSGLLTGDTKAPTAVIVDGMLAGALRFALSADLLNEYRNVLARPKLTKLHDLRPSELDELLTELAFFGRYFEPKPYTQVIPDEGDRHLFSLQGACGGLLVTGDRHLLEASLEDVLSPRSFLAIC